jgi:hypothetical protein
MMIDGFHELPAQTYLYQKDKKLIPTLTCHNYPKSTMLFFVYVHILGISSNEIRDMLNNNE